MELVGQNKLVNFSVPSLTRAGKHYSVWVVRPQEAEPVPHKVHELFVSCTCADHLYAVRVADQVRMPCLHGAAVVVALSQMAVDLPRAEVSRTRQSSAKSRAAALRPRSVGRARSPSRARSNKPLPYACGRCGLASRVELTECEGSCGRSCCGRCTAEQISSNGAIEFLCLCCRAALSLGEAAPSAGSMEDLSTASGRVEMMRHELQHVAMLRAQGDDVRERSSSPLEPWALNVGMETVRKGLRVVTICTDPIPDEVVDELLNEEGTSVLSAAEQRVGRLFGSVQGFEWSKADRSDEASSASMCS